MVDKVVRHAEGLSLEHDFEWVNAWAASTIREDVEPEPTNHAALEPVCIDAPGGQALLAIAPAPDPGLSDTAALAGSATADDFSKAAADGEPNGADAPALEPPIIAHLECRSAEVTAPDDRAEVPELVAGDETAAVTFAAPQDVAPPAGPRPDVRTWIGRKPWRTVFRIVARNPDPSALTTAAELPPQEASTTMPSVDVEAEGFPQERGETEVMRVPDQLAPAPDQLERDIAEIELVRDRLMVEPTAVDPRCATSTPSRTSDHVPILVGGALAFTMLVVFGAAASLVSLR